MSIFNQIKVNKPGRTAFNLSHNYKMTGEMGILYPIFCQDVVPGDTFKVSTEIFMRMQPLIAPMMSRVRIYTHYFFVPKRLLWKGWKEFYTGASQSKARTDIDNFVVPEYPRLQFATDYVTGVFPNAGDVGKVPFTSRELADYLGFPVFQHGNADNRAVKGNLVVLDELPFRAYQLIWNEYYRDENLMDEQDIHFERDGVHVVDPQDEEDLNLMYLRRRAWKKDYFTSALPFAQAGPDVLLPLTGLQDNRLELMVDYLPGAVHEGEFTRTGILSERLSEYTSNFGLSANDGFLNNPNDSHSSINLDVPRDSDGYSVIGVDNRQLKNLMSNIGSATINELRRAFAAQRFLEATARGGSRYIEMLYSLFGVRSSDARLQRPEYLGGGVQDIVVSDVLQTSASVDVGNQKSPQANQAGVGASIGRTASFNRYFEAPGYVIGIMSILPDASYMQGMPKQYTKFDRLDHYWPQFAHLGEQEIKQHELYFTGLPQSGSMTDYDDTPIFGYTPRYAEYKYVPSSIHGDFREDLSFWHLGRIFNSAPALNKEFIWAEPRKDVFAVTEKGTHHFLFNIQHHFKAIRPMPRFGTPS